MEEKTIKKSMVYTGEVVSDKMNKTIVVNTRRTLMHPRFHKIVSVNKKYKVHDENEEANIGDIVEFYEGRPKSKTKYMYLSRIIKPRFA
jgi:small subunit ribosomal protein S17